MWPAQIIGNTITDNTADFGAGIAVVQADTPTIENNVVEGNTASQQGGGLYAVGKSDANVVQNIFAMNSAAAGAGLYVAPPSASRGAWLNNDTVFGNNGPGLWVDGFDTNMVVTNTLVVAPAGSAAVVCATTDNPGAPTFVADDLYNGTAAPNNGPCLNPNLSDGNLSVDPLFVNAAGGDLHLKGISPVINAGANNAPNLPLTDLDGNLRIAFGAVDMGVYEAQIIPPGPVTNMQASRSGSTITITWSAPLSSGGSPITSYVIAESPGTTQTVGGGTTSVTYTHTKRNTPYTFTVVAVNAAGAGPSSSITLPKA